MLTRVGDEHMGRFVRETLAAKASTSTARQAPTRSGSRDSCCSASRAQRASRTSSIARTAPTWGSRPATWTPRRSPARRRSRSRARTSRRTARSCSRAARDCAREAAWPAHRARHRLPARALGPCRPRRRRRSRAGFGRSDAPAAALPARTATWLSAPKRRSASPAAAERARGAAGDPRAHARRRS